VLRQFAANLLSRLEAIPGVDGAAVANILPAMGYSPGAGFVVEHQPVTDPARMPRAGYRAVSAGFFEALRVPIRNGRAFTAADREDTQPVAVVSASLAARYWPGQDPVGRRLRLDRPGGGEWVNVVGVAGDVSMYNWWDGEDAAAIYFPLRQAPPVGSLQAVLRTKGEPAAASAAVRQVLRGIDPLLPVHRVRSMQQAIEESSTGLGYLAMLMGVCGGIALALSILGIYSVMAYTVSQRTHEFGVRIALGATSGDVVRLTLQQAGTLTAVGVAVGLLIAGALGKLMSSAFVGVVALDAMTFVEAGAALAFVSLAAAYLPARRSLRLDPASVLRSD
jgi:putative ABC transport system permease protein